MIAFPTIGSTCAYKFITKFQSLDEIYTLTKLSSFQTVVDEGVDFYKTLYEPLGLTKEQLAADYGAYQSDTIATLVTVNNETQTTYHIPNSILAEIPDPYVQEYLSIYTAIDLGYIDVPSKLDWFRTEIEELAKSVTGTTETTNMFLSTKKWMPISDYEAYDEQRKERIKKVIPLKTAIVKRDQQIVQLKDQIRQYQDAIIALRAKITELTP